MKQRFYLTEFQSHDARRNFFHSMSVETASCFAQQIFKGVLTFAA